MSEDLCDARDLDDGRDDNDGRRELRGGQDDVRRRGLDGEEGLRGLRWGGQRVERRAAGGRQRGEDALLLRRVLCGVREARHEDAVRRCVLGAVLVPDGERRVEE